MTEPYYSLAWSNENGGAVALMLRDACLRLSPAIAMQLAFDLCRVLETPDAAAAMVAGDEISRSDLLSRVQAIGRPLHTALNDGRSDSDGGLRQTQDNRDQLPDISRDLVALTMRRLLALCGDIDAGLFAADLAQTEKENAGG